MRSGFIGDLGAMVGAHAPIKGPKGTWLLPQLYASTAPAAKGGLFYGPKTLRMRGYPAAQKCNAALDDGALRSRFWQVSEALTGVAYL